MKWLAVVPALGVFALLIGALRAGGTPNQPAPVARSNARDAWDIPIAKQGEVTSGMVAFADLPAHIAPLSEADFRKSVDQRSQMPATKALVAFVPETYDDYLAVHARKNRLRITRFWYSQGNDAKVAAELLGDMPSPIVACAEHTWCFAREHTLSFELSPKLAPTNVTTDGPQALTDCFATWKIPSSAATKLRRGTKVVVSFVAMKL